MSRRLTFLMSIANLFSPNDYSLYCEQLTAGSVVIDGGSGAIDTNTIDAVNFGDIMNIAPVKASSIIIGHVPITVSLIGNEVLISNDLRVNTIRPNGAGVITIGSSATGLNLIPTSGDIIIDNAAPTANSVAIGNFGCASVVIGKPGGLSQFLSPLQFQSGTGTITRFDDMTMLSGTGSGCIPNTAGFINFRAQRINNIVRLSWRFSGVVTAATAAATLMIVEALPVEFRPANQMSFIAMLIGDSNLGGGIPSIPTTQLPGMCRISAAGAIDFFFSPTFHNSSNNWAIGENVAVTGGSASYAAA